VVGVTAIAVFWLGTERELGREDVEQVRIGMSEAEVEQTMGRPADREHHPWDVAVWLPPRAGTYPDWEKAWDARQGTILVHFDARGAVCERGFMALETTEGPVAQATPNPLRFLWRLLGGR
jgi:hypothetical protein